MEGAVVRAANLGLQSIALELARDLGNQADTAPSAFPVFSHIAAARALMIAGADEGEVQDKLERAQSLFPQNDKAIVGVGVVSGAIVWGSSVLDSQARREIANLRARMGEIDAAIQIMNGIDEPVFAWNDMLTPEIPIETLDGLLDAARDAVSREGHAYLRAQHAQEMLFFGGSEEQKFWAQETATALLQTEELDGARAVLIYSTLTRIGARLGDEEIQSMALEKMAETALNSRGFSEMITAGFEWYQSDLAP
ncbi:hypothetical protein GCM10011415_24080 [Salipiger pallidus]|uniref:Uncharacterized protein n=1 Tax=Salipiger pallidus TaxID=1775170 RepID=A0A8J2ZKN6_9RHOB|nr:hypothetical protein [Salipiger pallidus]GGG74761.1 hypothetical protein GCM10011415_24080 [Salipiger pallidus]